MQLLDRNRSAKVQVFSIGSAKKGLKIGFVPMTDCAALIAAHELGFFQKRGLNVQLSREAGWATVRERIVHRELEISHAHASLLFELTCGPGNRKAPCLTGTVLAHNGSAISLSNELWERGVRDARSLKKTIVALKGKRRLKFAIVQKYTTQNYILRQWLLRGGIDPENDVEMVIVPPPQVFDCMKNGHIDGYCAGEPWSSIGLLEGVCWCPALTCEVEPMHPEKVLLVSERFASEQHDEHIAMISAIIEAAHYCDKPINRASIADMLSQPRYLNANRQALLNGLQGPFQKGLGGQSSSRDAIIFHRHGANAPTEEKARWVYNEISKYKLMNNLPNLGSDDFQRLFRMDLYEEGLRASNVS